MLKIAHRGASAYEPENTLGAFKKALNLKVNAIEFDVRKSKDNQVIVIHDSKLDRTTNGKGNVNKFTLKELKKFRIEHKQKISSLKEALKFLRNKCTILIEIKDNNIEKRVIKEISNTMKNFENIIVVSFNSETIKKVKLIEPMISTGLIFSNKITNLRGFFKLNKAIKSDWLVGNYKVIDKKFIELAHKWKFKVIAWVLDEKSLIKKFRKLSVDGIVSNKPDLLN